ncbi:diguanylate cyclase [Streptomyces alboflavus]|uniref:Diguanylate cyclase n=1 Tax=Streptomyces alboflavus TaxID=67267 RepID=A0A1Z1WRM4_9ACTN|nr:diguanylate cyclase [Streptomyces alboflavus]
MIYHHSRRVYFFGALQGRNRGLSFDPELLYVAAMFHDVGLGEGARRSGRRFEVDGAEEAKRFLRGHGLPEDSVRRVWTAIALHTTPGIPEFMEPEVALVTAGVEYDVLGIGYDDIPAADRAAIVALHPRPDFKRRILDAFPKASAPSRRRRSATSRRTSWRPTSPGSSGVTSCGPSWTRHGGVAARGGPTASGGPVAPGGAATSSSSSPSTACSSST